MYTVHLTVNEISCSVTATSVPWEAIMATIYIIVTSEVVTHSRMYSELGKKGSWRRIPGYKMSVGLGKRVAYFGITRDTATDVFGIGSYAPCPASLHRQPFHAYVREDNGRGFRLQLYEPRFGDRKSIQGRGSTVRQCIQIHDGPGKSQGCLSIVGGTVSYQKFEKLMRRFLKKTQEIRVTIEQR
jgi:hypothetical protein